jgi:hypothetical protein
VIASVSSGDGVGIHRGFREIFVPQNYIFGAPLSETSTYLNKTLASIGLTPGAYVYSWGTGEHADTFYGRRRRQPPRGPRTVDLGNDADRISWPRLRGGPAQGRRVCDLGIGARPAHASPGNF